MTFSISQIKQLSQKYMNLFMNGKGMRGNIARGGIWLGIGGGSEHFLRLVRNMILTRLIAPEAFGVVAIVLAINTFFESFTQIGIKEAIIQNPRGSEYVYLNGAFWISAIRGAVLYGCAFFSVPLIAGFYNNPELVPMMRVAFISILAYGFFSPRAYASLKEMNYRKWVFIQHFGSIIGILTAIVAGIYMRNVWALIIGFTVENCARFILSYVICPFLPSFQFDRESITSLAKFARGIFGLPILAFLYTRVDIFVLGKLVSVSMLGYYSMAFGLVQIPLLIYNVIINPMLFPALAKLQSNTVQFTKGILHSIKIISYIFLPLFVILALFAPMILKTAYGEPYAQASIAFQILSLSMAFKILGAIFVSVYFSIGDPQMTRTASLVRLLVLLVTVIPLAMLWGINGAALASAISGVVWFSVFLYNFNKSFNISYSQYIRSVSPGLMVSFGITCAVLLVMVIL